MVVCHGKRWRSNRKPTDSRARVMASSVPSKPRRGSGTVATKNCRSRFCFSMASRRSSSEMRPGSAFPVTRCAASNRRESKDAHGEVGLLGTVSDGEIASFAGGVWGGSAHRPTPVPASRKKNAATKAPRNLRMRPTITNLGVCSGKKPCEQTKDRLGFCCG